MDERTTTTADFGLFIGTDVPDASLSIPFYQGTVEEGHNIPFEYHERAVIRTARIHPRDPDVVWLERHMRMTQLFVGLGDAPLAMVLGPPNHERGRDTPDLEDVRTFVFPPGHGILIRRGTWHDFPMALDRPVTVLTANSEEVVEALVHQRGAEEMDRGDVREVVEGLGVDSPQDVHLVQMKGAIPPYDRDLEQRLLADGISLRCDMVHSRGASALGVALALDEVAPERLGDDVVCRDFSLFSGVASCSAKPGLRRTEILAFANSRDWGGDLIIGHGCLADILDIDGMRSVAEGVGIDVGFPPDPAQVDKLVGVFAKSEADPRGTVRGRRHTMLRDDDIGDTRYSRCVLASVLSAVLGDTRVYVSTRAEHHGPLGGGPLAIVARA